MVLIKKGGSEMSNILARTTLEKAAIVLINGANSDELKNLHDLIEQRMKDIKANIKYETGVRYDELIVLKSLKKMMANEAVIYLGIDEKTRSIKIGHVEKLSRLQTRLDELGFLDKKHRMKDQTSIAFWVFPDYNLGKTKKGQTKLLSAEIEFSLHKSKDGMYQQSVKGTKDWFNNKKTPFEKAKSAAISEWYQLCDDKGDDGYFDQKINELMIGISHFIDTKLVKYNLEQIRSL